MENQQLSNLNEKQLQLITSAKFGDGHLSTTSLKGNSNYCTNCIYKEYLLHKQNVLGDLARKICYVEKNGFAQKPIYTLSSNTNSAITLIRDESIETSLNRLNKLGLSYWFYDDGSLHKTKHFYNLNTHKFSAEIQRDLFIPFLQKFDIYAKLTKETKKDGREFHYLRISRFEGAFEMSEIMRANYINCFDYKIWSSETMNLFSKLRVELKLRGAVITNKHMGLFMNRALLGENVQDIVRSLEKSKAPKLQWVGVN